MCREPTSDVIHRNSGIEKKKMKKSCQLEVAEKSGLFGKGRAGSGCVDIFHQSKKILGADVFLFCIGKEAFQGRGDEVCARALVFLQGAEEPLVLAFRTTECDGFHIHTQPIVTLFSPYSQKSLQSYH